MNPEQVPGASIHDWAHASLNVTELKSPDGGESLFELRKEMIINGVRQVQFIWLTRLQLRSIGIDQGL